MAQDPWDAFGERDSDSSDSSDSDNATDKYHYNDKKQVDHVGSFLAIYFRKISTVQRVINAPLRFTNHTLFHISTEGPYDAFIVETGQVLSTHFIDQMIDKIVPGGLLVFSLQHEDRPGTTAVTPPTSLCPPPISFDEQVWEEPKGIYGDIVYRRLRPIQIAHETAHWHKPRNLTLERQRISVVALSAQERAKHRILDEATCKAAASLIHETGYCILTGLEDGTACLDYGNTVVSDLHTAAKILLHKPDGESVDLYHPSDSLNDPSTYKELSMREDCRMDLRDGPQIRNQRLHGGTPLNNHPDILKIVSLVMNPTPFTAANYGRMNFDDGEQSKPSLVAGEVGAIVTLPGAADQTIHADTPHLYEQVHLPPHYVNAFTLGCRPRDNIGQTAFIHGSHRLDFVQKYIRSNTGDLDTSVYDFMVRPRMNLGDVVLFDCRILHFGLGNASTDSERPLLYCNFTQPWFRDGKNWDNEFSVFS